MSPKDDLQKSDLNTGEEGTETDAEEVVSEDKETPQKKKPILLATMEGSDEDTPAVAEDEDDDEEEDGDASSYGKCDEKCHKEEIY